MYVELFRYFEGGLQLIVGHFSRHEIGELKKEGYRFAKPNTNKHGIPIR